MLIIDIVGPLPEKVKRDVLLLIRDLIESLVGGGEREQKVAARKGFGK